MKILRAIINANTRAWDWVMHLATTPVHAARLAELLAIVSIILGAATTGGVVTACYLNRKGQRS